MRLSARGARTANAGAQRTKAPQHAERLPKRNAVSNSISLWPAEWLTEEEASLEEQARDLDEQTEGRKRERKDQKGLACLAESRGFGLILHLSPPFVLQVIYRTFVRKVEGILEKPSSF